MSLLEALRTLPGRCQSCGAHVQTQGHKATCTPEARRDAGIAAAEDHADPRIVLTVDAVIRELAASGQPFSANDVRKRVSAPGRGLAGARVRAALQRRQLRQVGEVKSDLGSTHAKPIGLYVGATTSAHSREGNAATG